MRAPKRVAGSKQIFVSAKISLFCANTPREGIYPMVSRWRMKEYARSDAGSHSRPFCLTAVAGLETYALKAIAANAVQSIWQAANEAATGELDALRAEARLQASEAEAQRDLAGAAVVVAEQEKGRGPAHRTGGGAGEGAGRRRASAEAQLAEESAVAMKPIDYKPEAPVFARIVRIPLTAVT